MARIGSFYRRRHHNETWIVVKQTTYHVMLESVGHAIIGTSVSHQISVPKHSFKKTWVKIPTSIDLQNRVVDQEVDKLMATIYSTEK